MYQKETAFSSQSSLPFLYLTCAYACSITSACLESMCSLFSGAMQMMLSVALLYSPDVGDK